MGPSRRQIAFHLSLLTGLVTGIAAAADTDRPRTVVEQVRGFERRSGPVTFYVDRAEGRIWLWLPTPDEDGFAGEFLYVEGLLSGLGSNPVGLDRGQLGESRLIRLRRLGNKVLVEAPNLGFRADSEDPGERRAVEQSFATSVLWGAEAEVVDPDGSALVDFTSFIVRDAHGVVARLRDSDQGAYALSTERSAVDLEACLAFPNNVELEAVLTFTTGGSPGSEVRAVAPEATSITVVQHHSIVALPAAGYSPRRFDPRAGSFAVGYQDYAAPLDEPLERRWIVRHRLQKVDPAAARSEVVDPIVYYVDRGAPEPVRSALVEGASWWAEAFADAGLLDAFRVELLPEGAHHLDVRYNVIQWVHRATRGWSYGGGVVDPRTGERLKGHVSLGSLRVRHDRLLFEGLLGAGATGTGAADDPVELALARVRQLAAHEVGHTLGLAHNFAASTYADRASVMDYPAPRIDITEDGELDPSRAYAVGVGAWDRHAIRWAYSQFPPGVDEDRALGAIVDAGLAAGYLFLSDADARPAGAAHPAANLWDNGADPVLELGHLMRVRGIALERFGERSVASGTPLALLQEVLAPLYYHHRYQVAAAAKALGGVEYRHAVRGDGEPGAASPVAGAKQRRALESLLETLAPAALDLPDATIELLLPRPFGYGSNRELFEGAMAPVFDPLAAASAAAELVVGAILEPRRLARLVDQHRRDPELPSLEEVVDAVTAAGFASPSLPRRHRELSRIVLAAVANQLIRVAGDPSAAPSVRWRAELRLGALVGRMSDSGVPHQEVLARRIERFLDRPEGAADAEPGQPLPPGSPIGRRQSDAAGLGACSLY